MLHTVFPPYALQRAVATALVPDLVGIVPVGSLIAPVDLSLFVLSSLCSVSVALCVTKTHRD